MVSIMPGQLADMQIKKAISSEGPEEFFHQLGIHFAEHRAFKCYVPAHIGSAGKVDHGIDKGFIHRHGRLPEALDTTFIAQCIGNGLSQDNADILNRVMGINLQIALGDNGQIKQTVSPESIEHMVEKPNAGIDGGLACPIQINGNDDIGLVGLAAE